MGESSDEPSLTDRFRSWARHHATNGRASTKQAPILPQSQQHQPQDLRADVLPRPSTTTRQITNTFTHTNGGNDDIKIDIPDNSPTASPPAAPPPKDTEAQGEKSAALGQNGQPPKAPIPIRMKNGLIRFGKHAKNAIFHSWINVLLVFVPIGIAANFAHLNPEIIFAINAIAIVPLAGLLTYATETVASRLGDTWGALLNVSFGNAVELIIFIIGLVKNEIRIVQAALLGSILANLLLILGMAFLLGGLRFQEQIYNNTVTQMSACLLSLSVMSLLLPTAFHASFSNTTTADISTLKISRGTSVVLLLVYLLFLLFQLKSHSYLYESMPQERIDEESHPGILHDLLDSSTSSSSSSSDDDSDTDTTSGSVTTAKRIRRAFRHRKRRKSSASSKDTPSLPSHLSSPAGELNASYFEEGYYNSGQRRSSNLGPILSGDGADDDAEKDRRLSSTRVRDFETGRGESSRSPERPIHSPSLVFSHKKKYHKRNHRRTKRAEKQEGGVEKPPITEAAQQIQSNDGPRVGFVEDLHDSGETPESKKTPPSSKLRQLATRPTLPKLLSQNVFTTPPQRGASVPTGPANRNNIPAIRRTASLPDRLNRQQVQSQTAGTTGSSKLLPPYIARPPSAPTPAATDSDDEDDKLQMSRTAAIIMLLVSTGLVALCAEFLVGAIPNMTSKSSVSQAFIGLIILPIVGNAAEHVTAVTVATKNKMDLAIGVAVGSSIQIALFVTPVVVLLGWIMNRAMTLYFTLFETISLFVTAFVINFLILDGKSNYLEGTLLIAAYVIIAVAAFFYPDSDSQSLLGGSDSHNATMTAAQMLSKMMV